MRPFRFLLACTVTTALAATAGSGAAHAAPDQETDGTVRIVVVDDPGRPVTATATDPDGTGLHTVAMADVGGRLLALPAGAETAALQPGERVRVTLAPGPRGPRVRSVQPVQPVQPAAGAGRVGTRGVAAPVTGTHALTLLPVYWSTPDAETLASLTALATSTAAFWSAQSGGRLTIVPTVRDWARIADPGSCDVEALANEALAANRVAMPVSAFDHVAIYFPARSDCAGWAGLGQIGAGLIWDNGVPLTDVLAHEFGHNLGLGHANAATCTQSGLRVTLSATCSVQGYRDYADVMGAAMDRPTGNLNTALADWLGLATTVTVPAGGRTTVDLAPLGQTGGTRAVRIRVGSAWLYADYRPAVAPDTRWPAWAGVQLHLLPDGSYPATRLLDAQPTTPSLSAVSLPPGRAWAVPGAGLTLTVVSVSTAGARLTVAPTTSDAATPAAVVTAPAAGAVVGTAVQVTWRLAADAAVRVLVDGTLRAAPAGRARAGSVTLTGLTDGAHVLTVQTLDGTGTVVATSVPVPVTIDATPPPSPAGLGLSGGDVLSWRAAPDAASGPTGYLVALDSAAPVRLGSVTSVRVRTPTGRHTWWVAAVDRVGNISPAAGLVVVRTASTRSRPTVVRASGPVSAADVPRTLTTSRTVGGTRML